MASLQHLAQRVAPLTVALGCAGMIGENSVESPSDPGTAMEAPGGPGASVPTGMPAMPVPVPEEGMTRAKEILPGSPLTALTCRESARGTTEEAIRRLSRVEVDSTVRVLAGGLYTRAKDALYLFPADVVNDSLGEFES